jgi:transposase-like protein
MDKEKRLNNLAVKIENIRSQGVVKEWSKEVKNEALSLINEFGINKVAERTKLHLQSLYVWRKKNEDIISSDIEILDEKIHVSHILSTQINKNSNEEKCPICSLFKKDIELKIYDKKLAKRISKRFFL